MGTRRAMREGRWCNAAPEGYRNDRDDRGKPVLVSSDDAGLIREAFELAAFSDLAISEIQLRLRKGGLKCSRSRLYEILKSPVYKGYIDEVPAWRDEPYELVRGLHDPSCPPRCGTACRRPASGRRPTLSWTLALCRVG